MKLNHSDLLKFALNFADESKKILQKNYFKTFNIEEKNDGSLVTNIDKEIEEKFRKLLKKKFPEHGVIGEEFPVEKIKDRLQDLVEKLKKELMRRKAELDAEAKEKGMKEEPMTQADLDSERFADMHDFEEYKDAVMSDIKDPKSMYAGKSKQEIIAMLRKEADGIGYADVSDGDRRPEEPTWLNKIADEMEDEKTSDTTEELDRIKHLAGLTSN